MRRFARFPLSECPDWRLRLQAWAASFDHCLLLDSNDHPAAGWDMLVGAGARRRIACPAGAAFETLKAFQAEVQDWLFVFLSYDLKNELEDLQSAHPDGIMWPDLAFFQPEHVAGVRAGWLEIYTLSERPEAVWQAIAGAETKPVPTTSTPALQPRMSREHYLATVEAVRQHIIAGDVYELNLCQEFYAENSVLDPLATYRRLNARTQAPASAYARWGDRYLLCGSPERFLQKQGAALRSQPIKGTRKRGATPEADTQIRQELAQSEKDRAENVMIVDLVRNDLARHCLPGSVRVEELFGIHSFPTVHQMISTVCGTLRPDTHPLDALRDAFPMGSMTGAPKVMAMSLIERYECTRRGLYSGAVGYLTPDLDFDFNVVIRSIVYHAGSGYVSVQAGGAIVYDSVPEQEYDECLVKAAAMMGVLEE